MIVSLGPKNGVVVSGNKMKWSGIIAAKFKTFYFQYMINNLSRKRGPDRSQIAGKVNPAKALPKVLVLGSQSGLGHEVVTALWTQLFPVRCGLHSGEVRDPIFERNYIEQVDIDLEKPFSIGLALKGIETLVLVAEPTQSTRFASASKIVAALKDREHSVKHIIKVYPYSLPLELSHLGVRIQIFP
jgi:hypothetical protein